MTESPTATISGRITPVRRRPRRLSARGRSLLLTGHIVVAVGALATDGVLLVLGVTALVSSNAELIRAGYLSTGILADAVLMPLALAALLTGVLLGLGTSWGLARHYWVLAKLGLTTATATAAAFVLRPALNRAAAEALQVPLADLPTAGIGQLGGTVTVAAAAALLVLLATATLAVFKPGGQTRFRRR
jgi:hypothetical protein